jgi:high-affinity nickel-transport protein
MNPTDLPRDFFSLALVILLLGMKHGFDADHLAAIDGLARYNARTRPRLARAAGALFSVGHGLVVASVAVGVSVLAHAWHVPQWLDAFGAWVSIGVLTLLALMNIVSVLRTPGQEVAKVKGWRSGMFARLLHAGSPVMVMGVGTLFALSFDTVSQAALFAVTATQFGGWRPALLLALVFVVGMLVIDAVNGVWIARLIRRSERSARVASRVMALAVSGVGLLTAALTFASRTLPDVDTWTQGKELWFGTAVVAVVGVSFAFGQQLARRYDDGSKAIVDTDRGRVLEPDSVQVARQDDRHGVLAAQHGAGEHVVAPEPVVGLVKIDTAFTIARERQGAPFLEQRLEPDLVACSSLRGCGLQHGVLLSGPRFLHRAG